MRRQFKKIWILAGMAFLAFSCQQENDMTSNQLEVEIDEVIEVIANNFLSVIIVGGDDKEPFIAEFENEESQNARIFFDEFDEKGSRVIISCLMALDLDQTQNQQIRRLFFGFETCKSNVTKEYNDEIRRLISKMEEVRKGLLHQLQNEEIRPDEFRTKLEALRIRYQLVVSEIREKHHKNLKPCIRGFVERLPLVLGGEGWTAFRKCIIG
jgi:hypothetical protein